MSEAVTTIAVVRALHGLGDMLCAVPSLRSLRQRWPDAEVTLVGVPRSRWVLDRWPHLVDRWIDLPHWPGIPEATGDPSDTLALLAEARPPFDLAIQLHGSGGTINGFTRSLGARRLAGHHEPGEPPPDRAFVPWPASGHEIERMLGVVAALGCPSDDTELEFPEQPDDARASAHIRSCLRRPYAAVHPGASRDDRRWDAAGFAAVADHLHDAGLDVVVTAGPDEAELARAVTERCDRASPVVPAAPMTLGGLAAVLRSASVLVANDTGVAHLGVACGTPTLVIGTTSDLPRWAPLDRLTHGAVQTSGRYDDDRSAVLAEADRLIAGR